MTHGGAAALPSTAAAGTARNKLAVLWAVVALGVAVTAGGSVAGLSPVPLMAAFALPLALVAWQRALLAWGTLLGAILVVILFIPIRRYTVGGGLPIELEPYRIAIALVLGCWLLALAADPRLHWRATGLEPPIIVFGTAILISLALNIGRVNPVSDVVLKQVSFFVSFFLVMYFVASVLDTRAQLDRILRLFVFGGAIVAVAALVEWRTGTNYFNGMNKVIPFLQYQDIGDAMIRGSGARALGSAQHPIALGAALVMLLPLSFYLFARDRRRIWLVCAALLTLGALSTGSRTAALMLIILGVAIVLIKPAQAMRLAPMLLPLVIVVQLVMPGTLGSFRGILQPSYVIQEQSVAGGSGSGRIADLGPSLTEWSAAPFFGQGFGTRVVNQEDPLAGVQILDDQWLGTLLEIGAIGTLGLAWLFIRTIRMLSRHARAEHGADGWLSATLAASLAAFAIGLFTYDAFAFIQVTFFSFIMLGFAAVAVRAPDPDRSAGPEPGAPA